jgi:hypothetical protein
MHILIATPLYPPDIAGHAPYVKELARRLSHEHTVTVVLYGSFPEVVAGVHLIGITKQQPALLRLYNFTKTLYTCARKADIILVQNGPSVELGMVFTKMFLWKKPFLLNVFDSGAFTYTNMLSSILLRIALKCASRIWTYTNTNPFIPASVSKKMMPEILTKPEILPFEPHPTDMLLQYEKAWEVHLSELNTECYDLCKK